MSKRKPYVPVRGPGGIGYVVHSPDGEPILESGSRHQLQVACAHLNDAFRFGIAAERQHARERKAKARKQ